MSVPRPPPAKGRSRGRLREQENPHCWSHILSDRSTNNPGQQNKNHSGYSENTSSKNLEPQNVRISGGGSRLKQLDGGSVGDKPAKSRTKKPEMAIYVPRAKRLQQQQEQYESKLDYSRAQPPPQRGIDKPDFNCFIDKVYETPDRDVLSVDLSKPDSRNRKTKREIPHSCDQLESNISYHGNYSSRVSVHSDPSGFTVEEHEMHKTGRYVKKESEQEINQSKKSNDNYICTLKKFKPEDRIKTDGIVEAFDECGGSDFVIDKYLSSPICETEIIAEDSKTRDRLLEPVKIDKSVPDCARTYSSFSHIQCEPLESLKNDDLDVSVDIDTKSFVNLTDGDKMKLETELMPATSNSLDICKSYSSGHLVHCSCDDSDISHDFQPKKSDDAGLDLKEHELFVSMDTGNPMNTCNIVLSQSPNMSELEQAHSDDITEVTIGPEKLDRKKPKDAYLLSDAENIASCMELECNSNEPESTIMSDSKHSYNISIDSLNSTPSKDASFSQADETVTTNSKILSDASISTNEILFMDGNPKMPLDSDMNEGGRKKCDETYKDIKNFSEEDWKLVADDEEDSWEKRFNEDGECLSPSAIAELTAIVGKVEIQKPKVNYLSYQPKEPEFHFEEYSHVIEVYDFPAEFLTRDLIAAFQSYISKGLDVKWVDDTHAMLVFSSAVAAADAVRTVNPLLKVRPLSEASKASQLKAKSCLEFLQPYKARPATTASAARRLVTGALGLTSRITKEQKDSERKKLKEAKEKKKQDRRNRDDIWEGTYGKCAMDKS